MSTPMSRRKSWKKRIIKRYPWLAGHVEWKDGVPWYGNKGTTVGDFWDQRGPAHP